MRQHTSKIRAIVPAFDPTLHNDIIAAICAGDTFTAHGWRNWLDRAGVTHDTQRRIGNWDGSAEDFAGALIGKLSHDELAAALRALPPAGGGVEWQTLLDALCARIEQHKLHPTLAGQPNPLLAAYRQHCIHRWQDQRYHVDKDFVRLIVLRRDEQRGWMEPEGAREYNDLRDLLREVPERAIVLLGAPGSGKSTLLRRLQMDEAADRLQDNGDTVSFFVPLNEYPEDATDARAWLAARWRDENAGVGDFDALLDAGRFLFLLDALNEVRLRSREDYPRQVAQWKQFAAVLTRKGNRAVFTCRSLDYSILLSDDNTPVPQVTVKPMTPALIKKFLEQYLRDEGLAERVFAKLKEDDRQLALYSTPYFLSLLVDQVAADGSVPAGRAALFTNFVRAALKRELERASPLLMNEALLSEEDRVAINTGDLHGYDLPEGGALLTQLTALAWHMQQPEQMADGSQVSLDRSRALALLAHPAANPRDVLKAGESLNILDKAEGGTHPVKFFHQLLQEYFAARQMAQQPNAALLAQAWRVGEVAEPLEETLAKLDDTDPLPPPPSSGWEETTRIAVPMMRDPAGFVRELMAHNLPQAGLIAAAPDVSLPEKFKDEMRWALVRRSQDMQADLRARITAGLALGALGDPRFERRATRDGKHLVLVPPMVSVPGGTVVIGLDKSDYKRETPAHPVEIAPFAMCAFAVTNAEYKCFIDAGGYDDARWWDTPAAKRWLAGDTSEGPRRGWTDIRSTLQARSEEYIQSLVAQNRVTSKQARDWITIRNWSDQEFENWLDEHFPKDKKLREPAQWFDPAFNAPAQPVVGVCWHEARAYCNWLSAETGHDFRLPTEAEWEAAARGTTGRMYAYEDVFDVAKGNTFESHIRRTTPVGIYANGAAIIQSHSSATEMNAIYDLTGNVWEWTSSVYLPYPYTRTPEREDPEHEAEWRVLRGGSWSLNSYLARAVYRSGNHPSSRSSSGGFRVVASAPVE